MDDRKTYVIKVRSLDKDDPRSVRLLARALKSMLRSFRLQCVSIDVERNDLLSKSDHAKLHVDGGPECLE